MYCNHAVDTAEMEISLFQRQVAYPGNSFNRKLNDPFPGSSPEFVKLQVHWAQAWNDNTRVKVHDNKKKPRIYAQIPKP